MNDEELFNLTTTVASGKCQVVRFEVEEAQKTKAKEIEISNHGEFTYFFNAIGEMIPQFRVEQIGFRFANRMKRELKLEIGSWDYGFQGANMDVIYIHSWPWDVVVTEQQVGDLEKLLTKHYKRGGIGA